MKLPVFAGANTFAHLLGRNAKAAEKAEDGDKRDDVDLEEEKGDGDDEGDGPKDGKAKRARADNSERDDAGDDDAGDDSEDDKKARRAKHAKADDGDDDEDDQGDDGSDGADMRARGTTRSARLRERARCAAIFADAAAGKNPALAAQVAFGTDLPRGQALSVLRAGGLAVASAPRRPSLDERMASVKVPAIGVGDAAAPTGAQGLAAQILAAGRKRRGEV